jgi:DnaD/phage-associated family protein
VNSLKSEQASPKFEGFPGGKDPLVPLPETFFTQLLPQFNDLNQIRLLLYLFWHMAQQEANIRFFLVEALSSDPTLIEMMGSNDQLETTIEELAQRGILLKNEVQDDDQTYYFINSPQGRAAFEALQQGTFDQHITPSSHLLGQNTKLNIYKLYEENIGTITPMMAEILKEDEATYPLSWIEEAIRMAVARNARNWKYIQAILGRWQKEGRGHEQNRRNDSQDPDSYRESWLRGK